MLNAVLTQNIRNRSIQILLWGLLLGHVCYGLISTFIWGRWAILFLGLGGFVCWLSPWLLLSLLTLLAGMLHLNPGSYEMWPFELFLSSVYIFFFFKRQQLSQKTLDYPAFLWILFCIFLYCLGSGFIHGWGSVVSDWGIVPKWMIVRNVLLANYHLPENGLRIALDFFMVISLFLVVLWHHHSQPKAFHKGVCCVKWVAILLLFLSSLILFKKLAWFSWATSVLDFLLPFSEKLGEGIIKWSFDPFFVNTGWMAQLLLIPFSLLLGEFLYHVTTRVRTKHVMFDFVGLTWTVTLILLCRQRAGWLALAGSLVVLFCFLIKNVGLRWFKSKEVIGITILLLPLLWWGSRFAYWNYISKSQYGLSGREYVWKVGIRAVQHHPWVGVGIGQSHLHLKKNRYGVDVPQGFVLETFHNFWLQLWVEGGTFYVLLWLWLILSLWTSARQHSHKLPRYSLLFLFLNFMLNGIGQEIFYNKAVFYLLWLAIWGVVSSRDTFEQKQAI